MRDVASTIFLSRARQRDEEREKKRRKGRGPNTRHCHVNTDRKDVLSYFKYSSIVPSKWEKERKRDKGERTRVQEKEKRSLKLLSCSRSFLVDLIAGRETLWMDDGKEKIRETERED